MEFGEFDEILCLREAGYTSEEIEEFFQDRKNEEETKVKCRNGL